MRPPARSVSGLPLVFLVGGTQSMVAEAVVGGVLLVTATLNAGSEAELVPLLALMTMSPYEPSCEVVGVPLRRPVAMLKVAHEGLFCTENDRVLPSGSLAVGWNL